MLPLNVLNCHNYGMPISTQTHTYILRETATTADAYTEVLHLPAARHTHIHIHKISH